MEDHQQDHSAHQVEVPQAEAHQEEVPQAEVHWEEARQCPFPPPQQSESEETTNW
jgi:hypothetical protein